ncbi:MAG: hypothetical protein RPU64_07455 [Candidatus Sedimenticola sp. (ex Thyasira tokunagai)]
MMMKKYQVLVFVPFFMILGCSSEDGNTTSEQSNEEHVFKDQIQALNKAKDVEQIIESATEKKRLVIDENSK